MRWIVPLAAFACSSAAVAEVTSRSDSGFAIAGRLTAVVTPEQAWAALVEPSVWWDPEHSWSGQGAYLLIEPRAGGCFCEVLPGGGSVEHMRVIYAAPGQQLRMSGALGPLQGEGLAATLSVTIEQQPEGTTLAWTYKVGGHTELPLEQIAPAVDAVLSAQFRRLSAHLDGEATVPVG
jgi:hypothetical protein